MHRCFMTDRTDQGFAFLPPAEAGLGAAFARPKLIAVACVVVLTALGWLALGADGRRTAAAFGALCRPAVGSR